MMNLNDLHFRNNWRVDGQSPSAAGDILNAFSSPFDHLAATCSPADFAKTTDRTARWHTGVASGVRTGDPGTICRAGPHTDHSDPCHHRRSHRPSASGRSGAWSNFSWSEHAVSPVLTAGSLSSKVRASTVAARNGSQRLLASEVSLPSRPDWPLARSAASQPAALSCCSHAGFPLSASCCSSGQPLPSCLHLKWSSLDSGPTCRTRTQMQDSMLWPERQGPTAF
jgi:hypothetical protein